MVGGEKPPPYRRNTRVLELNRNIVTRDVVMIMNVRNCLWEIERSFFDADIVAYVKLVRRPKTD